MPPVTNEKCFPLSECISITPCLEIDICQPSPYAPFMTCDSANIKLGVQVIPNGDSTVSVSGLGLTAIPIKIFSAIWCPQASSVVITGNVILTTVTADGFTVKLSAATAETGYQLVYLIFLES